MKLFVRSLRNGETVYSSYDGMTEEVVRGLMADLGHTSLELLTEIAFTNSKPVQVP